MNRTFTPVKPATALKSVFLFFVFAALIENLAWGQTLIYTEDFSSANPTGWTVVNNGSGNNWTLTSTGTPQSGTYHMQYSFNSANAADTWAFNQGVSMTAGNTYTVKFYERVQSATYPENLKLTVGSGQTVVSQTTTLITLASLTNTTYAEQTATFTPIISGTYYFAFNCYSAADMYNLFVDNIRIYETVNCTATITLGSNPVAASNICAGTTKVPLQSFSLAVAAGCNGNLTNVGFSTTGTYVQADISKYQLWYNTSNNLAGATQVGTDLASAGGAGARTFAAFTSPTLTAGSTYYFWITADVTATATNNNTIAVNAMQTSDLTSTSTKVLGSNAAGGTQTIIATPTTATNTSTQSICGGSATLSGNVPTFGTGAWTVFSGPSTSSTQFANTSIYNTTFTPAGGAGSYVVRWTISNSCTSTSADATISVSTSAPSCATMTAPANGATGQPVPGVTLTWNAVTGASGYDVYLQAGTNPPTTLVSSNQAGNSYATGPLNPSTTYYWYVVPRNICGAASGCSVSAFSFVTGTCTSDIYVTATAGTLTGSYTTLKGAFDKINDGTHKGVISISVGRNTTETASAALNSSGSGSASYSSVLIQPCGGSYTISGSLAGVPVINLNGADNVTINGINSGGNMLTIANTSATAGSSSIQFINDATNNIVRNCNIYSSNISTSSGTIVFSTTTGTTGNDNNTIEYCSIFDGTTAPYVGIYSSGTTTSTAHYNSNNTISNNKIYNFINPAGSDGWDTPGAGIFNTGSDFGIKLSVGTTAWTISGNSFYQNKSTTPYSNGTTATHYAINITNSTGTGFVVENNYIGGRAANCAGSAWTINQNTIKSNFTAIHLDVGVGGLSTINHNVIDNISVSTSAQGTSQDAPFIGILVRGYLDVSYNTLGGTSGIVFSSVSSAADFDGIYQFDESANAIGTYTTNNNSISNITISNTSGANANVYLLRAYSKNYQTTWTCNNNTIGGTTANSINCQNYHWVHGIFFSWGTSISASGNTIQNITCAYSGIHGIKEQSDAGGATTSSTYSGNTIKTIKCLSGQVNGILLDGGNSTNNLIERNLIYDLNGVTVTAINHSNSRSPFTDVIRNNMIAIGNSIATSTTRGIRYESSSGTCNIYHNSVYLHGSSTTTYCMEKATAATACIVKNNIFYNNCSSGSKYALYYSNTTGLTSDCNDLYVPSAQTGYIPSTGYTTLANWQAGTVYDDNSVSIDPGFLSLTVPYNLHVDSGIRVLNCTGLVTIDFDGEGRVVPHMGADEAPITLPVSLVRFDVSCSETGAMIFWSTATEINNNYFTLERSADLNEWSLVAKVQGAGNSNTLLNYSYSDKQSYNGINFYRLTQTDFNGESETFAPVMIHCDESFAEVSCYPNPFNDQLVVTLQNIGAEQGSLVLRDVTGRVVMQRELSSDDFGQQSVALTLSGIASGVYSLEFRAGSYEKTMRVVKDK